MGKVHNVSLTPIKSCNSNIPCSKSCYAIRSYRMFKPTRETWDGNYNLAMNNRVEYFNSIESYLSKVKKPSLFRWHVAGDILDQDYLDNMCRVAGNFTDWKFLAFTKKHELQYDTPDNLNVVFSMWPNWGNPDTSKPIAWMQDGTETRITGKTYECNGNCENCKICWNLKGGESVVFIKH